MSNEFVTVKRADLERALEALGEIVQNSAYKWLVDKAIKAAKPLRAALKQPGVEAVAWLITYEYLATSSNIGGSLKKFDEVWSKGSFVSDIKDAEIDAKQFRNRDEIPLYAAPQPAQQPVATVSEVHMSRYTIEWTNGPLPEGTSLYAAPQNGKAPKPAQQPETLCDCKGRFYDRCESAWEPCCTLGNSAEHAVAVSNITTTKQQPEADKLLRQALEAMEVQGSEWVILERNAIAAIRKYLGEA